MLRADRGADRGVAALSRRYCAGCGEPFTPHRKTQTSCRPSCRVRACTARRVRRAAADADGDQLARGRFE
jgi:hypothetical protein